VRAVLPWPVRSVRRQAIADARRDRIAAERKAAAAREAQERLQRAVKDNHIAQAIAWHVRGRGSQ
jgi:hypothetical protein